MTAPERIDPLAVMDAVIRESDDEGQFLLGTDMHGHLVEVLAKAAELVDADREYDEARIEAACTKSSRHDDQWPRLVAAKKRRAAALAAFGRQG